MTVLWFSKRILGRPSGSRGRGFRFQVFPDREANWGQPSVRISGGSLGFQGSYKA